MTSWDYKVETPRVQREALQGELEPLGREGWELVAMTEYREEPNAMPVFTCVFKRPARGGQVDPTKTAVALAPGQVDPTKTKVTPAPG